MRPYGTKRKKESKPDPEQDAAVILAAMDKSQQRRYLCTADPREALQKLTRERRRSGPIRPPANDLNEEQLVEYREGVSVVEAALGPFWRTVERANMILFALSGWAFLGFGVLAVVVGFFTGSLSHVFGRWRFGEAGSFTTILLSLSALGLLLVTVAMVGAIFGMAVRDRRARPALIEWAVERPGQLGRGLPGLTGAGSSRATVRTVLWVGFWVGVLIAFFSVPVWGVALVTSIFGERLSWILTCLGFFVGSVLLVFVLFRLSKYLVRADARDERDAAAFTWRWARSRTLAPGRRGIGADVSKD